MSYASGDHGTACTELEAVRSWMEKVQHNDETVPAEIFTDQFVELYTDFATSERFLTDLPHDASDGGGLEAVDETEAFVREKTIADSWTELRSLATEEYVLQTLGLK